MEKDKSIAEIAKNSSLNYSLLMFINAKMLSIKKVDFLITTGISKPNTKKMIFIKVKKNKSTVKIAKYSFFNFSDESELVLELDTQITILRVSICIAIQSILISIIVWISNQFATSKKRKLKNR